MEYDDFHLEVSRSGEAFLAIVRDGDREVVREFFSPPYSLQELKHRLARLESTIRDARCEEEDPRDIARYLGESLFQAAFSGAVYGAWLSQLQGARRKGQGLRLRVYLDDAESISWPWELLRDKAGKWLATSRETPLIRSLKNVPTARSFSLAGPLNVVVMAAHPAGSNCLDSDQEWKELREAFRHRRIAVERLPSGDLGALCARLQRPVHVLHFIGHGAGTADEGHLALEGPCGERDPTSGNDLATVLRDHSSLGLVVLNACEGARVQGSDTFSGVAQSLIRAGIPAVIAMQLPVSDRAAIAFSRHFYRNLAVGCALEEAVCEARKSLFSERFAFEWLTPVLYMNGPVVTPPAPIPSWLTLVVSAALILLAGSLFQGDIAHNSPSASKLLSRTENRSASVSTKGCPTSLSSGLTFVRIPEGRFRMGSKPRAEEERFHEVRISKPFCIGTHEVTVGQWRRVMGDSLPGLDERLPITGVSWEEIEVFTAKLNEWEPGVRFRLPTEAEWEYSARAGSVEKFSFGDDPEDLHLYGNCRNLEADDGFEGLAPVGSFRPNGFGLYDVFGNASEWVADWYAPYPPNAVIDPVGPLYGEDRVRRGGSHEIVPDRCDAVFRNRSKPDSKKSDVGFRLVRDVVEEKAGQPSKRAAP